MARLLCRVLQTLDKDLFTLAPQRLYRVLHSVKSPLRKSTSKNLFVECDEPTLSKIKKITVVTALRRALVLTIDKPCAFAECFGPDTRQNLCLYRVLYLPAKQVSRWSSLVTLSSVMNIALGEVIFYTHIFIHIILAG
jgi:hypothetical protein